MPLDYLAVTESSKLEEARQAVRGQNTWMLWGQGNEVFWGWLQEQGYGLADLLVLLDSRQRGSRFKDLGVVNQPGMRTQQGEPVLGLYLDEADPDPKNKVWLEGLTGPYPAGYSEPFAIGNRRLYESTIARLAQDGVDPRVYGYPSGVVGLRLMPNPDFFGATPAAEKARAYWKEKVTDAAPGAYYVKDTKNKPRQAIHADPALVRPFRVSMACAFCHVAPHPLNPPTDPENPRWANLSSIIGAQYWNPPKAFLNLKQPHSFLWQFVASQQRGTVDASLVSTDHINNANTMNAVFEVNARNQRALLNPPEEQSVANLLQPSSADPPNTSPRHTPRVLLDGSDSIGLEGALARVYLNIGAYGEQWQNLHNPLIGFTPQRPFELATIRNKSVYWQATERYRIPQLAAFFTHVTATKATVTQAMKLEATPEGRERLKKHEHLVKDGRQVFLQNCAVCHSSKQPAGFALEFSRDWRQASVTQSWPLTLPMDYADWDAYRLSPAHQAYVERLKSFVSDPKAAGKDFVSDNYLSTDIRVPVTLVGTNSGRAVGTNAMRGQVWDNFSSEDYKKLPAVGEVRFYNPSLAGKVASDPWGNNDSYAPPEGGPGYYRPASLVSLWATAPYLHNNTLGRFNAFGKEDPKAAVEKKEGGEQEKTPEKRIPSNDPDPSVAARLAGFDDGIDKMFWRSRRAEGSGHIGDLRKQLEGYADEPGFIYRTTEPTWIDIRAPFIRPLLAGVVGEGLLDFATGPLWWLGALIAVVLALVGRARWAGFVLAVFAASVAALLRATGIDSIHPLLWAIPGLAALCAAVFLLMPWLRLPARVFFGLSALVLLAIGLSLGAWVDGRGTDIDTIHPLLWAIPGLVALGAAVVLLLPWLRLPTRILFGLSALGLTAIGLWFGTLEDGRGSDIRLGPIPRGTPVNLVMNLSPEASGADLFHAVAGLTRGVLRMRKEFPGEGVERDDRALPVFLQEAEQPLLKASKCPDFVLDRGHWFAEALSDQEKQQLKAFLETL
ncbi:hypothetical protein GCM10007320_44830 [Pseudorhodoferax aquiterrae]|uniref:Cytochrome c domain-containing protein n=1 Tax=Pseudorhodoferax aquiterrae TaxID=747304 RepID=A0ABQ3G6S2_9BURK|nr:hypothetical protein GCM10007320_44830 [Pseudorhodoferax aquiterrae]